MVRRTGYAPEIDADGAGHLYSTADKTNGTYMRHSIHFALDVPVVSNFGGNWEGEKYTIVDTLGSVLAERKRPLANLMSNDTWFEQNPHEALKMPSARVFVADVEHSGAPAEQGPVTTYNPNTDDIRQLVAAERHKRGIEDPGAVTEHGWSMESPKSKQLQALARKLGVNQIGHVYTPEMWLEKRLGTQIGIADQVADNHERLNKLFNGQLRADWRVFANEYEFVDEAGEPANFAQLNVDWGRLPAWLTRGEQTEGGTLSLNRLLAQCSPEARRNFYASGLSVPRVNRIQGERKQILASDTAG